MYVYTSKYKYIPGYVDTWDESQSTPVGQNSQVNSDPSYYVPSGNLLHSYWKLQVIADVFPWNMLMFHSYINLPEGTMYIHMYIYIHIYIYMYIYTYVIYQNVHLLYSQMVPVSWSQKSWLGWLHHISFAIYVVFLVCHQVEMRL